MSGTMGGTAFAPVPGSERNSVGLLFTDHQLQTTDDFRKLVELGPRALPFLLEALEDETPTMLIQRGGIGGVNFLTEMRGNPTNSLEQPAIAVLPHPELGFTLPGGGRLPLILSELAMLVSS
jgi:hypothetical protein